MTDTPDCAFSRSRGTSVKTPGAEHVSTVALETLSAPNATVETSDQTAALPLSLVAMV